MANLDLVKDTIIKQKLIKPGDIIGVATSGGTDSMALLCKLNELSQELDFEVVAIHVDHSIREESADDARFVLNFCKEHRIRAYKFKVDCKKYAKDKAISLESAAREARYGVFDAVINKGICDKIAVAHHLQDQAETILLHLFRGAGLSGIKGMSYTRGEQYIRPMLDVDKKEILEYINYHDIPYVVDESNFENEFTRNYLRNEIFPLLLKKWPNLVNTLITFSDSASDDDEYINSQLDFGAIIFAEKEAKIPLTYFVYPNAINSRIIFKALNGIGINKDIEKKHIELIRGLAKNSENGKKLNLPMGVVAIKEYDYLILTNVQKEKYELNKKYAKGSFDVKDFGEINIKRVKNIEPSDNCLFIDAKKLPNDAVWRYRKDGDIFEKFGGGTKKLKSFMIDKKIPARKRDYIPVLANDNEVFVIAGVEVSDKVRVDENSKAIDKIIVKQ